MPPKKFYTIFSTCHKRFADFWKVVSSDWSHFNQVWVDCFYQWILKGEVSLYRWPRVGQVWNQLYENWQFFCFNLLNRLIQTSQTGGQWYSDTSSLVFTGFYFQFLWQWLRLILDICSYETLSTVIKVLPLKSSWVSSLF